MTPRRRTDGGRARRPFSDPLEPFNQRSRQPSRSQRGLEDSTRREQATRHVSRLSARHDAPRVWRLAIYSAITVGITLIGWRLMHSLVWFSSLRRLSRGAIVGRTNAEVAASGFEIQPEPAAWVDPVGLAVGLALGLVITWVYARYFQHL